MPLNPNDPPKQDSLTDRGRRSAVRRDWRPDASPSEQVLDAVAAATGRAPDRLPPLYDVLDPDALDALLDARADADGSRPPITVEFRYEGCDVTVRRGVDVSPPRATRTDPAVGRPVRHRAPDRSSAAASSFRSAARMCSETVAVLMSRASATSSVLPSRGHS